MATTDLGTQRTSTVNRAKVLTNEQLKKVCRAQQLAVGGNKAVLQARVIQSLDDAMTRNDMVNFDRIRQMVMHQGELPPPSHMQATAPSNVPRAMPYNNYTNGISGNPYNRGPIPMPGSKPPGRGPATFKPSPFYTIEESLISSLILPRVLNSRNAVADHISLSDHVVQRMKSDPTLKIMLYCSAASITDPYQAFRDISFPGQIEVKLNDDEVKSNFKGLRNKPGTTKPADLTPLIRLMPRYRNQLKIVYATTDKDYTMAVNLVKKFSPEELTEKIKQERFIITKDSVLQEMLTKANDPDIVATSYVMSLKDPISTLRIETPVRSTLCNHNRCFDALCFIQLQEQAPTWTCPICNKAISFQALKVDHYVLDILKNTPKSVDQVTIEPEGSWAPVSQKQESDREPQQRAAYDQDDESDDELVEISDPKASAGVVIKQDPGQRNGHTQSMTPLSIRESSSRPPPPQGGGGGTGGKRPSAVIDLTLSDDDEPPRPAKRRASQSSNATNKTTTTYSTPNSLNMPSWSQQTAPFQQQRYSNQQDPRQYSFHANSPPGYRPQQLPSISSPQSAASPGAPNYTPNGQPAPWASNYAQGAYQTFSHPWRPNNNQSPYPS